MIPHFTLSEINNTPTLKPFISIQHPHSPIPTELLVVFSKTGFYLQLKYKSQCLDDLVNLRSSEDSHCRPRGPTLNKTLRGETWMAALLCCTKECILSCKWLNGLYMQRKGQHWAVNHVEANVSLSEAAQDNTHLYVGILLKIYYYIQLKVCHRPERSCCFFSFPVCYLLFLFFYFIVLISNFFCKLVYSLRLDRWDNDHDASKFDQQPIPQGKRTKHFHWRENWARCSLTVRNVRQ